MPRGHPGSRRIRLHWPGFSFSSSVHPRLRGASVGEVGYPLHTGQLTPPEGNDESRELRWTGVEDVLGLGLGAKERPRKWSGLKGDWRASECSWSGPSFSNKYYDT